MSETMPYKPATGIEGEVFAEHFCYRCAKFDPDKGCDIANRAWWYTLSDEQYPAEWVKDAGGDVTTARCAAFERREA